MYNNQKGFPTVFALALVTLLSCCFSPVSSYFTLPRVSRTSDAIIIDYEGVGYSPFSLGRGYSQFVDPGFVPLPAFNPYGMFYGGWPNFGRQGGAPAPAATCGRGPPPPTRSMISERITGTANAITYPVKASKTWPFLVVLRKSDAAPNVFFCSGTLISDTRVLLAAQCLEQLSVFEISSVTILVGLAPTTPAFTTQMTRRISKVVIHSGYNAAPYTNDIAIITLDMPVVFSLKVAPACLPTPSTDPDQHVDKDAAVMGPAAKGAASTAFKQGKVTIGSIGDCKGEGGGYSKYVTDNNICDAPGGAVFTCPGDVGGPVVLNTAPPTPGAAPIWTVVGINSYTEDTACTTPFKNGLKTRVSAFSAWITTYMV